MPGGLLEKVAYLGRCISYIGIIMLLLIFLRTFYNSNVQNTRGKLTPLTFATRHQPFIPNISSQKIVRAFSSDPLALQDDFARRHIGPSAKDSKNMLGVIGFDDMESMVKSTVPANILMDRPLAMDPAMTETEAVKHLKEVGS